MTDPALELHLLNQAREQQDPIYTDDRAMALRDRYGLSRFSNTDTRFNPQTMEEMEWVMTVTFGYLGAWPLARCREAIDQIDVLVAEGWTNEGWYKSGWVVGLIPGEKYRDNPLRLRALELEREGRPHRLVGFWYHDDDSRTFLLTPPEDYSI